MKKVFGGCVFLLIGCIVTAGIAVTQTNRFWLAKGDTENPVNFVVEPGDSLVAVADKLEEQEVIHSAFWLKVYLKLNKDTGQLQTGEYALAPGDSYARILRSLQSPKRHEVRITIPEGYTLDQIGDVVTNNFDITKEAWNFAVGPESPLVEHKFVVLAQKPAGVGLEGFLFPDTYNFFDTATAEDVVKKMIDTMERRVTDADVNMVTLSARTDEVTTLYDLLILASVVQREVLRPGEMKDVADIFYKRMQIGMRLQADSTVNYVTGKKTPGISLKDTELDTPYNTYLYAGLPVGPISNPGFDAIVAAAHPNPNPYYFFLTSPAGEVKYGVTHDDHIRNRNLYLR